jgi:hypothetical protein
MPRTAPPLFLDPQPGSAWCRSGTCGHANRVSNSILPVQRVPFTLMRPKGTPVDG